ncbi:hypothetical protein NIES2101_39025 [Calothrix sp. HK-06]|nr:hypothetical protein NIES2101_39025 [Calothrix sp. HK-06]
MQPAYPVLCITYFAIIRVTLYILLHHAKNSAEYDRNQSYIDKDMKRRFKLACTTIDKTMSEVMVELVETWLEEQENSKKEIQ